MQQPWKISKKRIIKKSLSNVPMRVSSHPKNDIQGCLMIKVPVRCMLQVRVLNVSKNARLLIAPSHLPSR